MSKSEERERAMTVVNGEGSSSNNLVAFNMQKKLFSTINELDRLYKENISAYGETLQRYNVDIEKLKNEIVTKERDVAKAERALIADETLIEYESKNFEKLHNELSKQIALLSELADEYKSLLSKEEYAKKITLKKRALLETLEEISEKERLLLNKELERLNHFSHYQERKKSLEQLESELKELELEKSYFESTELQKIGSLKGDGLSSETLETLPEVVETEVIDA